MDLLRRAAHISLLVVWQLTAACLGLCTLFVRRSGSEARQAFLGRQLALFCRRAGATFVKLGQVLATRADLFSEPFCRELGQLHDRVGPFSFELVRRTIFAELGQAPEELFTRLDPYPVASASISQVHRGTLPDGREVALKVLRPGVEREVATDLRAMMFWTVLLYWVPVVRRVGLSRVLVEFADALRRQLDLRIEAANNRRFLVNFRGDPEVSFPELVDALSARRVLCMTFVEGRRVLELGQEDKHRARRVAAIGYRMLLKMIFIDGFVHADLHPGNIFVRERAGRDELVLFDLGLVVRLTPRHTKALTSLCLAWAARDVGAICQALPTAAFYDEPPAEPRRLRAQVEALLARYGDVALGQIQIGALLLDLLRLVRQQWTRLDPAFSLVAVSIAVVEGVGRQLAPELRLMAEALPFLQRQGWQPRATSFGET